MLPLNVPPEARMTTWVTTQVAMFADPSDWQDDFTKRGYIFVEYLGIVRPARPKFGLGTFKVPTKDFVAKFRNSLLVSIQILNDDPSQLYWDGIFLHDGDLKGGATASDNYVNITESDKYPYYDIIDQNEDWIVLSIKDNPSHDAGTSSPKFKVRNLKDGSYVVIDRTKGSENIEIQDNTTKCHFRMDSNGIILEDGNGNKLISSSNGWSLSDGTNTITLNPNSGVEINNQYVVLKSFLDWLNKNQANIGLGNLGAPVPIHPSALSEFISNYQATKSANNSNDFKSD